MGNLMTCKNCGWVHFGVSKQHVNDWNIRWIELCKTQPEEWLQSFGIKNRIPPSDKIYYQCFFCGGPHTNFRESKPGDCPEGCTIQPILDESL